LEAGITSSWYEPAHDGEGFLLEMLANNLAVMYWFTYDDQGALDWFVAVGEVRVNRIVFPELYRASGGEFGPGFDPETVQIEPWGTLELDLDCYGGTATYTSSEEGFGSGTLNVVRLTSIDQLDCPQ